MKVTTMNGDDPFDRGEQEAGRKRFAALNARADQLRGKITREEADKRIRDAENVRDGGSVTEVNADGVGITKRAGGVTEFRRLDGGPLSIGDMHRALAGPNAPALNRAMANSTTHYRADGYVVT